MVEAMRTITAATILASGLATRYAPNVMDVVVANRTEWGELEPGVAHKGYVALLGCGHLGRTVWLEHEGRVDGPYIVADCAATQDWARLKRLRWAVDLSWEIAQEWGVIDDVGEGFTVWDADPRGILPEGFDEPY